MGGPNINNLFAQYVDTIPVLPVWVTSGQNADNYYRAKHLFTEVSLFTNPKFERKINELNLSQNQTNGIWYKINQFNQKMQSEFESKFKA